MAPSPTTIVKFLCSYGGKIVPRYPDGKLRYHGGDTRVFSVSRSVSFNELARKLGEICETTMSLRCQLPTHDLDSLVTITSDEDLANLMEEYDLTSMAQVKIRAFMYPLKSTRTTTTSFRPIKSAASASSFSSKSSSPSLPPPSTRHICIANDGDDTVVTTPFPVICFLPVSYLRRIVYISDFPETNPVYCR